MSQADPPRETTSVSLEVRRTLDYYPKTRPFSYLDLESYSFLEPIVVYDSLGGPRYFVMHFVNRGNGMWEMYHASNGNLGITNGTFQPATFLVDPEGPLVMPSAVYQIDYTAAQVGVGANSLSLQLHLSGGPPTSPWGTTSLISQDGFGAGFLSGVVLDTRGILTGNYSNRHERLFGQLALAEFPNPPALGQTGPNRFLETGLSGQPMVSAPSRDGAGLIVDLGQSGGSFGVASASSATGIVGGSSSESSLNARLVGGGVQGFAQAAWVKSFVAGDSDANDSDPNADLLLVLQESSAVAA